MRGFAEARKEHEAAFLALLGIGPLEADTRAIVPGLGLEAVVMPGRLAIRDWLERAAVFAHSSRWRASASCCWRRC